MDSPIVTRFAPSPTGRLHLGHALAAWEARSLADRFSGRCVLRMEDIDRTRCRPEFVGGILEDLDWLGIRFDGPMMVQSSRFSAYEHALQILKDRGVLYPLFLHAPGDCGGGGRHGRRAAGRPRGRLSGNLPPA